MTTKCIACGKFVPYSQMEERGGASFYFEPDNEFGRERSEWTCAECVKRESARYPAAADTQSDVDIGSCKTCIVSDAAENRSLLGDYDGC